MQRILGITFFLSVFITSAFAANDKQNDIVLTHQTALTEINSIVEDFRLSIINKDKARFKQLFYAEDIPWLGVFTPTSLAFVHKKNPKAAPISQSNYSDFIDWILSQSGAVEEKFWNIKILTDQSVASVHFDYSFHIGDYKSNWGQEAWQMIKTEQGWKINSVIYSMTMNQLPRQKAVDKK